MSNAKTGRPRSEKSREAIIKATRDLLHEGGGAGLTIEAIARRAGVGKPTIYRWWPALADIVLEALLRQAETVIEAPSADSLRESLRGFLRQSMRAIDEGAGEHLRFLMAQAQKDEEFRARFRDNFVAERRAALRSIFEQAITRGEISADRSPDLLTDMIFGAMWYRLLTGHAALDEFFADELTEAAMRLVEARSA